MQFLLSLCLNYDLSQIRCLDNLSSFSISLDTSKNNILLGGQPDFKVCLNICDDLDKANIQSKHSMHQIIFEKLLILFSVTHQGGSAGL